MTENGLRQSLTAKQDNTEQVAEMTKGWSPVTHLTRKETHKGLHAKSKNSQTRGLTARVSRSNPEPSTTSTTTTSNLPLPPPTPPHPTNPHPPPHQSCACLCIHVGQIGRAWNHCNALQWSASWPACPLRCSVHATNSSFTIYPSLCTLHSEHFSVVSVARSRFILQFTLTLHVVTQAWFSNKKSAPKGAQPNSSHFTIYCVRHTHNF